MNKKAIIIGAGPAGLTAAYELLKKTDIIPVILEKSGDIGGISKTVNYKGNRIDIGGHRFFSKSDRVMDWWLNIMPVQTDGKDIFSISYQNKSREVNATTSVNNFSGDESDKVMLIRKRLSRIYFLRKFFTYPIQLSLDTLTKLGIWTTMAIMFSYLKAQIVPRKPEMNLEDFMINRFGEVLYKLFFKDYTEKVWGVACNKISAEWGAQRIKGVSITKAIQHALHLARKSKKSKEGVDLGQKDTETSLIEQFLYPKLGPGQLWEEVARQVEEMGGVILMHQDVKCIYTEESGECVTAVSAINSVTGETSYLEGDYFFSTMPIQELIGGLNGSIPEDVKHVASGLQYRDFITVGVLLKKLSFRDKKTGEWKPLDLNDTWIYIQEKDVKVGRLQIFNNWSPYMVKDPETTWVGMEFFCNTEDDFWKLPDARIKQLAIGELEKIGLASEANVLDATVLRMEKTYPAYFGTYDRFDVIQNYIDKFENLFLVGRNGMHKYNNSDHSMLTAMVAVDNIAAGIKSKKNIWAINTEQEYHEEKQESRQGDENVLVKASGTSSGRLESNLKDYIFKNANNRLFVWTGIFGILIQFIIFKWLYPFAGFINGDSYAYLEAAYHNLDIYFYPIGYSRLLRLFSVFTKSDLALVTFQYLLLQGGIMYFLFTLFYFYNPRRVVKAILFYFMLFNPVFLYLSNYVSSDAVFLSLSLIWLTQLFWIVYRPTNRMILQNVVLLFILFTIRYNALYYPIIMAIAFLLSRAHVGTKVAAFALGLILIGGFVQHTSNKYNILTGKRQFSPFTGWQLANNALYAYRYIDSADVKPVPAEFKELDRMVRTYFDTTRDTKKHPQEMLQASTVYMWAPISPLQEYMKRKIPNDTSIGKLKQWATVAPLYAEYGAYLIKKYPAEFAEYYLWPNALKYYAPPVEFLQTYSTGVDSVPRIALAWFGYKSNKLTTQFRDFKVGVLNFYPVLIGVMNVVFLLGFISFILLDGLRNNRCLYKGLWLIIPLWMTNLGFSVFASPIALRFQLFPALVSMSFTILFIEYVIREARGQQMAELNPNLKNLERELVDVKLKLQN
ncbi:NAD(P)/FAD-dependent oxidoreductase [Chitinophaga agrisoli]|uniref:NAD(P)/FAD-dependent oxidoreductase n=1 Tax=Chitinophaga agrisoli TaxID=2607653 RepID=A0A5B2VLV3_9BACT|nr:NAD(P)/FAD-dependent oxidoreductase [Chitinophaga agrisoli]KAA2239885.1 NAD(P)/FAD-dependent oxidoreductase [Chitinophaga agrisoli]